jgi:hypothetical protein
MITRIGLAAGDIWNHLDNHGGSCGMEDLIRDIRIERDMVLMSIGWLAREGHIVLESGTTGYNVKLKK